MIRHRPVARGRVRVAGMNKMESAYRDVLHGRVLVGDVLWFRYEAMKLRLADNTFYSPDFAVMLASGELEVHEVKGHWEDDARVKIKVAAEQYPFRFCAVTAIASKHGGGWKVEEF
jgi:hypothetical protein